MYILFIILQVSINEENIVHFEYTVPLSEGSVFKVSNEPRLFYTTYIGICKE